MPRKVLTAGGWWRHSNALSPNFDTTLISVRSGMSASDLLEGFEILRVRVHNNGTVFSGGTVVSSSWSLVVDYFPAATFLLTRIATLVDPWIDPLLGLDGNAQRFIDIPGYRIAVGVQTSTYTGPDLNPTSYNADGVIRLYVGGVEIWSATGLTFAHKSPFQSENTRIAFGVPICMDRIWVRNGLVPPNDDANGAVPVTADRLLYEDTGNLVGWFAWQADPAALFALPHVIADVGALEGVGYSVSTAGGTALVTSSGGGANARGLRQLITLTEPPPPPDPPPVTTQACPDTLGPTATTGGVACPVGGATLTES